MAMLGISSRILLCGLAIVWAGLPAISQQKPADTKELQEARARKKELLKLMDKLEVKLPPELARKLIIISMKVSTGYCSPTATRELAEAIGQLPGKDRKKFEKEWEQVREHPEWPCKKFAQPAPEQKKE